MRNNIRLSKTLSLTRGLLLYWIILAVTPAVSQTPNYEMAIRITHESPADAEPTFADNIQGITQDGSYWYVTQTEDLWKFPIGMNWNDVSAGGSVLHTELDDYIDGPPYVSSLFNHMGDLAYHPCGVLIIPLHGDDVESALLVVSAQDLSALSWTNLNDKGYHNASFCAVDDEGDVYLSGSGWGDMVGYSLNCSSFQFTYKRTCTLKDENNATHERQHKQGAVFSPSGDLFFMSTGYGTENSDSVIDGIHVFETEGLNWTRVAHSTNGYGLFNYQWDPSDEEPEGMTWIDLDGAGVPGMSGQLHILLLNNDDFDSDNIFFKHYTNRIYVSLNTPFPPGNGTIAFPFKTVSAASAMAWDGCEIRIHAGSYNEAVIFDKRSTIVPIGGTVVIGE